MLWNAEITGCQLEFGRSVADPLLGRKIDLWGHFNEYIGTTFNQPKVVELDSTSLWTRQVYSGQLCLGRRDASIKSGYLVNGYVKAVQSARFHKGRHYVDLRPHWNADEIGRADLFQSVIAKNDLLVLENDIHSDVLACFREALTEDASACGLVVQYVLFNASSPLTPNIPTVCSLVGTLGVWRTSEMCSFPAGRVLVPVTCGGEAEARSRGSLTVHVSDRGISLNALIGMPFRQRGERPAGGPAHSPGQVAMDSDVFILEAGGARPIASIDRELVRNTEVFLGNGGILDVPFLSTEVRRDPEAFRDRDLIIARRGDDGGFVPLYEERPVVVESDVGTLYLDVPNLAEGLTFDQEITVRSYVRGLPAQVTSIELLAWPNPAVYAHRPAGTAPQEIGPKLLFKQSDAVDDFTDKLSFSTDMAGTARISIRGASSGSARVLLVSGAAEREALAALAPLSCRERYDNAGELGIWSRAGTFYVKVLPNDWHVYHQPPERVDFEFLYEHVLQFYELLYPFMNEEVFSLSNGPKCRAHALLNWQMCDPINRDRSYYMPPTRELSYPKAMLFSKFLRSSAKIGYVPRRRAKGQ
jgi:hypothetical protein